MRQYLPTGLTMGQTYTDCLVFMEDGSVFDQCTFVRATFVTYGGEVFIQNSVISCCRQMFFEEYLEKYNGPN